ncbi:Mitochondrial oxaloacetate carrier protein, partial [Clydaea vesicula]
VIKTRLQLQGELQLHQRELIYKNPFSSFSSIYKKEGLRGIQKGLGPAYIYQILLNGTR